MPEIPEDTVNTSVLVDDFLMLCAQIATLAAVDNFDDLIIAGVENFYVHRAAEGHPMPSFFRELIERSLLIVAPAAAALEAMSLEFKAQIDAEVYGSDNPLEEQQQQAALDRLLTAMSDAILEDEPDHADVEVALIDPSQVFSRN